MSSNNVVKTGILVLALVLLLGVLTMAFGYYDNNIGLMYAGIAVIFLTSLNILLQNILSKKETKRKFHLNSNGRMN